MAEAPSVRSERDGPVTTVILSRPDVRNAVDRPTAARLAEAFLAFERDPEARVGVFFGEHGSFCAGADLKALSEEADETGRGDWGVPPSSGPGWNPLATDGPMGPTRMLLSKPVVAAVAGHAVAGGLELALWCDLRVLEEDAVLGVFCRRWGVPLVDGGTVRLPRIVGHGRALDLVLTGRPVDAREALAMGLASRVVPRGESRGAAERLAHELARFPQTCLRSDRRSVYEQWGLELPEALAGEYERGLETLRSGESAAGASRFASGRGRGGSFGDL